ncbi:MAG: double-strand break repair helicase AddA [Asticcacaulis sp.]
MTLNPQIIASDPLASCFVTANAGSGKTTTLVGRVARLLLHGARPEAMLCVTYTKAAAAEMQRRLFEQLGGWSVAEDGALRDALRKVGEDPDQIDPARARALFARALETPGGLKIQTIHAFCEKLLRRFPLEAGLTPGFVVLDEEQARRLSDLAQAALARSVLSDAESNLAKAYGRLVVSMTDGNFGDLLRGFEAQSEVLTFAFETLSGSGLSVTDWVWTKLGLEPGRTVEILRSETEARLDADLLDSARERLATGAKTFAEKAAELAPILEALRCGDPLFDALLDWMTTNDGTLSKRLMDAKPIKDLPALHERFLALGEALMAYRSGVFALEIAQNTADALTLAGFHLKAFAHEKQIRRALDFNDLIAATRRLLTTREDAAWVLYKLDGGLDHVLIDEAQDTAPDQWQILRALTQEIFAGEGAPGYVPGRTRTVFAVGDEKQSIYGFQGAAPEKFLDERQQYIQQGEAVGQKVVSPNLLESWRSTPEVLTFVDAVLSGQGASKVLPGSPGFELPPHIARRTDGPGCVDLWPWEQESAAEEPEAWDAPLDQIGEGSALKRLARRIARDIRERIETGETVLDKETRQWRPMTAGDVLILVRGRDGLFEEIIRALKQSGVPVAGADRLKLTEHIVFMDLMALIRFCLFPQDDLSLACVLRSPLCDLDEQDLFELACGRDGTLWAALTRRGDERPHWRSARMFLGWAREAAATHQAFDFLGLVLNRRDDGGLSQRQRILTRMGPEAEDALDETLAQAVAAEGRGDGELERFVAAMTTLTKDVKRELEDAHGQVRVMTVHGSKGLEAPVVYLPDTMRGQRDRSGPLLRGDDPLPFLVLGGKGRDADATQAIRTQINEKSTAEDLRLLYVALTRARDRIVVCGRLNARSKDAPESSWYAHIRAAFAHPDIAAHVREIDFADGSGSFRRFGADPERRGAMAAAVASATTALPAFLGTLAPVAGSGPRRVSPSELLGREAKDAAPSPLAGGAVGLGRFRRGNLIHSLFQMLPDLEPDARVAAASAWLSRQPDLSPDQQAEIAEAVLRVLGDARFAAVFGPGSRAEVAIAGEAPGLRYPGGPPVSLSGRLDRLVLSADQVLVIDYKTNRPAPAMPEATDPAYLAQMAAYVDVLKAIYPDRTVGAALVWTDGPALMPLPLALLDQALADARARLAGGRQHGSPLDPAQPDDYL